MTKRLRIKLVRNSLLTISIIIFVILLVIFSMQIYRLAKFKTCIEKVIFTEENATEINNVADLKHRMEFHGCLACWKDSVGVWWFYRDGKQCKLWSPKQ